MLAELNTVSLVGVHAVFTVWPEPAVEQAVQGAVPDALHVLPATHAAAPPLKTVSLVGVHAVLTVWPGPAVEQAVHGAVPDALHVLPATHAAPLKTVSLVGVHAVLTVWPEPAVEHAVQGALPDALHVLPATHERAGTEYAFAYAVVAPTMIGVQAPPVAAIGRMAGVPPVPGLHVVVLKRLTLTCEAVIAAWTLKPEPRTLPLHPWTAAISITSGDEPTVEQSVEVEKTWMTAALFGWAVVVNSITFERKAVPPIVTALQLPRVLSVTVNEVELPEQVPDEVNHCTVALVWVMAEIVVEVAPEVPSALPVQLSVKPDR